MNISNDVLKNYDILYVEDNKEISEEIEFFLKPLVKNLYIAYNGKEGVEFFEKYKPDIVITDIQMPVSNGIDMIKSIRQHNTEIPIIITTAFNESSYLLDAINLHVNSYLLKPLNLKSFLEEVKKVAEVIELRKEVVEANKKLKDINSNLSNIVKEKTAKLKYLYSHDAVTGLLNYASLSQEFEKKEYYYVILLDISNFSLINKEYGKDIANSILKETGRQLEKHENKFFKLYKIESDEFVFLSKIETAKEIEDFCKQIIAFFDNKPVMVDEIELSINFSFGVAPIRENVFPLIDADYALEKAKLLGSRYFYMSSDTTEDIQKTNEKIKWLKVTQELVKNEWIEPYYQPIMDAKSKKIVKYEVLARGVYYSEVISPFYFAKNAERLGIITAVTRSMINKSFAYLSGKNIAFSINLTQRDLLDDTFPKFLDEKLTKYNIDSSLVTFEILENITTSFQKNLLMKHLKILKKMGFKIAIDDFGMDNSNFGRFMEMDFDFLKLDAVFIKNIAANEKDRILVTTITNLAHSFGIETVAEFVENEVIEEIVKECGVDFLQGYHIGKPSPFIDEANGC